MKLAEPYLKNLLNYAPKDETVANLRKSIRNIRVSKESFSNANVNSLIKINGLYKLKSRITEFLVDEKCEECRFVQRFINKFNLIEKSSETCMVETRKTLDVLKHRILDTRWPEMMIYLNEMGKTEDFNIESRISLVSKVVEECLEKTILTKISDRIFQTISKANRVYDLKIDKKINQQINLPQSFFGIPWILESSNEWKLPIIEINDMNSSFCPQDKIKSILNCISAIVNSAQLEQEKKMQDELDEKDEYDEKSQNNQNKNNESNPNLKNHSNDSKSNFPNPNSNFNLSADDLLPILIYVIIHSNISNLESQSQYIWNLSDPDDLTGESGYYLTMFSSTIEYLKDLSEPQPNSTSNITDSIEFEIISDDSSNILQDQNQISYNEDSSALPPANHAFSQALKSGQIKSNQDLNQIIIGSQRESKSLNISKSSQTTQTQNQKCQKSSVSSPMSMNTNITMSTNSISPNSPRQIITHNISPNHD